MKKNWFSLLTTTIALSFVMSGQAQAYTEDFSSGVLNPTFWKKDEQNITNAEVQSVEDSLAAVVTMTEASGKRTEYTRKGTERNYDQGKTYCLKFKFMLRDFAPNAYAVPDWMSIMQTHGSANPSTSAPANCKQGSRNSVAIGVTKDKLTIWALTSPADQHPGEGAWGQVKKTYSLRDDAMMNRFHNVAIKYRPATIHDSLPGILKVRFNDEEVVNYTGPNLDANWCEGSPYTRGTYFKWGLYRRINGLANPGRQTGVYDNISSNQISPDAPCE